MPTKRRRTVNPWATLGKSAGRQMQRMQRVVTRAVTASVTQAVSDQGKAARRALSGVTTPAAAPRVRAGGRWEEGVWGFGPLAQRRYRLFLPTGIGLSRPAPMLVLLHGCGQDAASFAACTRAASLARTRRCIVLLPEQSQQANSNRCWNWFRGEAQIAAEAGLLMGLIDHVCRTHPVRREQLHLLGLSAGGAMALTMGLRFPDRFAAVGSHSGAVPHVAGNAAQAARVMRGAMSTHSALQLQALRVRLAGRTPPPLLLIHGGSDRVVGVDNALASAGLWLTLSAPPHGAAPAIFAPHPERAMQRGQRHAYTVQDWWRDGRPYVRLVRVPALGHAWSGGAAGQAYADPAGPDALRIAFAFIDAATSAVRVRRTAVG